MNAIEYIEYLKLKSPGKKARRFNHIDKNKQIAELLGETQRYLEKNKRILTPNEWLILP